MHVHGQKRQTKGIAVTIADGMTPPDFELPEKFAYALELNAEFFAELGTAERTVAR